VYTVERSGIYVPRRKASSEYIHACLAVKLGQLVSYDEAGFAHPKRSESFTKLELKFTPKAELIFKGQSLLKDTRLRTRLSSASQQTNESLSTTQKLCVRVGKTTISNSTTRNKNSHQPISNSNKWHANSKYWK
jgi:hypothetical protein